MNSAARRNSPVGVLKGFERVDPLSRSPHHKHSVPCHLEGVGDCDEVRLHIRNRGVGVHPQLNYN